MITLFSPAPWQLSVEPNGYFIYSVPGKESNQPAIAHVYDQHPHDACLMVAAPLLLSSLREMREHLISGARFGMNHDEIAMLQRADKAISEAEAQLI